MSRTRRCRTPGKVRYPNRSAALRALRRIPLTAGLYQPTRAYRCRCRGYHLTSR